MENEYSPAPAEAPIEGAQAEGAAPQSEQAPVEPVQNSWDPKPWELKYNGQPVYPKDQNHLKMLAQKGWSYEQKMAELNRQQGQWGQEREQLEKLKPYQELDNLFKTNPAFASEIMRLKEQFANGQPGQDPNQQLPQLQPIQQEIEELKTWRQTQLQNAENEKLEKSKTDLKEKFKDFDWDGVNEDGHTLMQRVMKHALETKMYDINRAFRDLMFDEIQLRASTQGRAQAGQAIQQAHRAGIVEGGKPSPQAPAKPWSPAGKSWNDVGKEAAAELARSMSGNR